MFGKDEKLEKMKDALIAMGCDMSDFRSWQKQYEKVKKQWRSESERYQKAHAITERVETIADRFEEILTSQWGADQSEVMQLVKELKQLQNSFDHEFIISKNDQDFHSTYDAIIKLGAKALEDAQQRILFQSEIENLLQMLRENLVKKAPDAKKLCIFYMYKNDLDLEELSASDKLASVESVYQIMFFEPIIKLLTYAIAKADEKKELLESSSDRRSKKSLESVQFLLNSTLAASSPDERAVMLFEEIMAAV